MRALTKTMRDYYTSLLNHGTNVPFQDQMLNFNQLQEQLGTEDLVARGQSY
jgi:2-methylisocitrate lyase-like PEP mutase family enzyme